MRSKVSAKSANEATDPRSRRCVAQPKKKKRSKLSTGPGAGRPRRAVVFVVIRRRDAARTATVAPTACSGRRGVEAERERNPNGERSPLRRGASRRLSTRLGGGDGNRTRVEGFADLCLSHSATPPERISVPCDPTKGSGDDDPSARSRCRGARPACGGRRDGGGMGTGGRSRHAGVCPPDEDTLTLAWEAGASALARPESVRSTSTACGGGRAARRSPRGRARRSSRPRSVSPTTRPARCAPVRPTPAWRRSGAADAIGAGSAASRSSSSPTRSARGSAPPTKPARGPVRRRSSSVARRRCVDRRAG